MRTRARCPTHRWIWLLVFLAALAGSYLSFGPFRTEMPINTLDSSWNTVLGEAGRLGFSAGEDLVFTYGPLSAVHTGYFDEHFLWLKLAFRLLLTLAFALLVTFLASAWRRPGAAIAMSMALIFFHFTDATFLALPMLAALLAITASSSRPTLVISLLGVAATAIATLAKFSGTPIAVVAFLVTDAFRLYWRRPPLHLLVYLGSLFALFSLVDDPAVFLPYLVNSFSVTAGYSDAMSLAGPEVETARYIVLSAVLLSWIFVSEAVAVRNGRLTASEALGRSIVIATYVFVVWKLGFVRHDAHSLNAWYGLAIAALTYATIAPLGEKPTLSRELGAVAPIAFAFVVLFMILSGVQSRHPLYGDALFARLTQRLIEAREFVTGPFRWAERRRSIKEAAWAKIRAQLPLPLLKGSVDVVPSIQSAVLANELDYRPRPSFQEFGTYTPWLIELNRRSLVERGPQYLLFRPEGLDGRHPALSEGPLWKEILRLYVPSALHADLLVLRRRSKPLSPTLLGPKTAAITRFGEVIAIPPDTHPQFMKVSVRKTMLGHIVSLLWRPSLIFMDATFENGLAQRFRIIPGIAREGFLISPFVSSAAEFLMVATGRASVPLRVNSIKFESGRLASWLYRPDINLTFQTFDEAPLRDQVLPEDFEHEAQSIAALLQLKNSVRPHIEVSFVPEGLLAHPPMALSITLEQNAAGIEARYGIQDGALPPGVTDGVCFKILVRRQQQSRMLHDRCLDPLGSAADRGEQRVRLDEALEAGDVLTFETSCRANCSYDWSYWSKIMLNRALAEH